MILVAAGIPDTLGKLSVINYILSLVQLESVLSANIGSVCSLESIVELVIKEYSESHKPGYLNDHAQKMPLDSIERRLTTGAVTIRLRICVQVHDSLDGFE